VRLSVLLAFLMPTMCFADGYGVPGIPSINEVPAFWGMLNNDPKYHDAAFKAQEAFFLQTGITQHYQLVTGYVSGKVTNVAKFAERNTAQFIDENTPLNSKHVFFAVGFGYAVLVKKEVTQKFRNPLFRNINHTVTIGQGHESLGIQIPF